MREISAARALCVSLRMCVCTYVFVVVCIGAQIKRCSRSGEQELKKNKKTKQGETAVLEIPQENFKFRL